jgi:hypothetical protein
MERCEVDGFGRDKFVACLGSQVHDKVDEERIAQRLLGQEDELSASRGEIFSYLYSDPGSCSLEYRCQRNAISKYPGNSLSS